MEERKKPICPYCGHEMLLDDAWVFPFYRCFRCKSAAPPAHDADEAYKLATQGRRLEPKGKWLTEEHFERTIDGSTIAIRATYCSECGCVLLGKFDNFCPNCGAYMREEVNDEID